MQALYDRIMKEGRSIDNASLGMVELCRQSGATIEGMGFLVEKAFENGRYER